MAYPGAVPASVGKRVLAYVIDALAAFLLGGAFLSAGAWQIAAVAGGDGTPGGALTLSLVGLVLLLGVGIAQWWYNGTRGATLGKALVGLRLLDADTGRPIGMGRALVRGLVVAAGALAFSVGQLVVLASPLFDSSGRRQGWHDKVVRAILLDVVTGADPSRAGATEAVVAARLDGLLAPVASVDLPPGAPVAPAPPASPGVVSAASAASGAAPAPGAVAPPPRTAAPAPPVSAPTPAPAPAPAPTPAPAPAPQGAAPAAPFPPAPAPAPPFPPVPPVPTGQNGHNGHNGPVGGGEAPAPTAPDFLAPFPAAVPPAPGPGEPLVREPAGGLGPLGGVDEYDDDSTGIIAAVPALIAAAPGPRTPAPDVPPLEPTVLVDHVPEDLAVRPADAEDEGSEDDEDLDDVEATRLSLAGTSAAKRRRGPARAVLNLWNGDEVTLTGFALVGRNPVRRDDEPLPERIIAVPDPRRSVSKTHLAVGVDPVGTWVRDRGSTNGTVVTLPDGAQVICAPGQQVRVPVGATVSFGDFWFTVA